MTLDAGSDTGNSSTDSITKAASVTINGNGANANANATVRLYANGSLLATATADASGGFSFAGVDVSGLSGTVNFTVRQVIAGMESADSAVRTVTFDRTAPTIAIATVAGDNVLNAADSAAGQTVSGTATGVEDGQTVTVTLNGKTYSTTVTNNAWSLSIPSADLLALPDGGHYSITADLSDVAGNAAVQATRGVSVDRTPPTVAIATVAGDNVLNAADSAVGQTVSGVTTGVEDGQTVTVTLNGKTYSTTVTNNAWSLSIPSADLLALPDGGSHTVTASLADAAGNATQGTRSVSVDRTPPSVVSVTAPPAQTYLPGDTVSFYVQLSETAIVSGSPVLELAVGGSIRSATYNAAGSTGTLMRFDYVVPVGDRAPQGISVLGLALNGGTVMDAAQGPLLTALKGVGDTSQVRIDTPVPTKPAGTALSGLSDSGASATDRLTNVAKPTLSGTVEPNATVTVMVDGKAVGTAVADSNGFWVHQLQTALTDGTHSITTTATNRFGIVSEPSDALVVVIDTAKPVTPAPSVTSATVAGTAAGARVSGVATPSIGGTTEAGSTVNILVDGRVAGTAVADANGAWTFQFPTALADGTHSVQVQATDTAGNVSDTSAVTTLVIDTTPPAAPTVTLNSTAGSTPVVQGTAEANSLVTVTVNGQTVGTARASATGVWQLALAADLGVGSYAISARATDAVGNTGTAGTTTYTVAPPPPPVVTVAASTGNTTTAVSTSTTAATGTGTTQASGPTLGTAPTLPSLQTSSDAGRVITASSIGSGSSSGSSSTDAGRSITISNIGNSTSSDAGRSITITAIGGAPSSGGTASSSNAVLGGGAGGSGGSGLSNVVSGGGGLGGGFGGGVGGGSGLGGGTGGIGAGLGGTGGVGTAGPGGSALGGAPAGGVSTVGTGTGSPAAGGPAGGTGTGSVTGAPGTASGGAPGGGTGPGPASGGLGGAPGNRFGNQPGTGTTIENAPANRGGQGGPQGPGQGNQGQGQPQGQPPSGDAPAAGDPANAPAGTDGQGQAPGPRADLDGSAPPRPAFSRQVAQIHGASDAQSAALLAALTTHVPPGSRAA
ncbi:Ig-like domain [Roseomonas genomospecies 6]|uniref:Ig-like domain n=1 Tax=Roseomonas genomospecies 6 TaxID=214106 RepID=A0A9W7NHB8_9PROT|nr:Ig-like domain [Roseomonas genomospecies 6]